MLLRAPSASALRSLATTTKSRTHLSTSLFTTLRLPSPLPKPTFSQLTSRPISTSLPLKSTPMAAPTDTQAAETATESNLTITPSSIETILKSKLNATYVAVEDMSGGCGQAFNAIIVSPDFEKKTHLQRHRLVNSALKKEIAAIHAWTPRCLTPEQWEKEKGE